MKKYLCILPIIILLILTACNNPGNYERNGIVERPVEISVLAKAQAGSTYRITITGPGMQQIGPTDYPGGQTIELYVPEGTTRAFHFDRYNQSSVLTDTGTTVKDIGSGMNSVTVTLVSAIAPATNAVTYDGNGNTGGSAPSAQTKTQGVALTLASNTGALARTGFTFAGWNTSANGSGTDYAVGASYTVDVAVTLYAKWTTLPTYTVTYEGNSNTGGTVPSAQTKMQGVALTLAGNTGNLVRTGFTFAGWNTSVNGSGTDYAIGASYNADAAVMLYAKWTTLPTYTVTYDGNSSTGGTTPSAQTKTQGVALTLAGNAGNLVRTGFTFAGWNTSVNGSGTDYAIGASYNADAAVTLYAKWTTLPTYTVTYDGNSSTGGTTPSAQTKTQGVALTLAGNTGNLVRTGFTFSGWNTAVNGSGTDYAVGASYAADTAATLYAKWTALLTYTVTYDGNSSTGGTIPSAQTKTQGAALTLAGNTGNLLRTGFTFAGWNTAANGSGTDYAVGAIYNADTAVTLYAKWTNLPTYTVTYDGNGNTGGTAPSSQTKTQGIALTLTGNTGTLVYTGFTFAGWNTSANGSGTDYAVGASYTGDAAVTLYAKWTALPTYTVAYDGNSSTGGTAPSTQTKTQGVALTLAGNTGNLARTGFTFTGWNTAANGGGTDYAVGASYTADASATLYAKWTSLPTYTVTYDGNSSTGGTAPSAQTKTKGIALTLADNTGNLVRAGFSFAGWNAAANGSGTDYAVGASYSGDTAVTLYAKWTSLPTYTVTYNGNSSTGGTAPSAQTKTQGIMLTLAGNTGNLARTGFSFAGWNTAANGSGTDYAAGANYTVDAAVTLYAKWTALLTYPVTYDGNGNDNGTVPSGQTKTQGIALTISGNTGNLVRAGLGFGGWNTSAYADGTNYPVGASYTADASVTLYAKWVSLTYIVTYDGNGNSGGSVPSPQTKMLGLALTLADSTALPYRVNYLFGGWNTTPEGNGSDYSVGGSFTTDANTTLYAKWLPPVSGPTVTDADGNTYTSVVIGTQTWTVENLRTTKYNDGTVIPLVTDTTQWQGLIAGAHCFYGNTTNAAEKQNWGALYNWYALNTGKLAPAGWHVPSDADWQVLSDYLGGITVAGGKLKNSSVGGTNERGFNALPFGYRGFDGLFKSQNSTGAWWSSTIIDAQNASFRTINSSGAELNTITFRKVGGATVRLVKD